MPMVEPSEADEQGDEDDDMTDEDVEPPTIAPDESVDDETSDTQGDLLSLVRERSLAVDRCAQVRLGAHQKRT